MSQLTINTTQNVTINFTAASVGERVGAHLIDLALKAAYCLVVYGIFFNYFLKNSIAHFDNFSLTALFILAFLPVVFYSFVLEATFEGQTVGKKLLKIKVVKLDGYQASVGDYLIRWLFCVIDTLLFVGFIGLITMIVNKKIQRLGDLTAGTAVITLKNKISLNSTILQDLDDNYVPHYPMVIKLSDNDVRIIKETFAMALARNDYEIIKKLENKIIDVSGIINKYETSENFIKTVMKDYNFYTQNM